ncbi:hypothetical protein M0805_005061 [Coniferiporia weirii]|nr:hypothetical protein M0805_005061 [Coniferiporia weirii]
MSRLPAPTASGLPTLTLSTSTLATAAATSNVTTRGMKAAMANSTNTLKRKAHDDDELEAMDQPRKLPAISGGIQRPGMGGPLRPSRTATNLPHARGTSGGMQPLSKSTGPAVPTRARATSAPPRNIGSLRPAASTSSLAARGRAPAGRVVSGGASRPTRAAGPGVDSKQFLALQDKVSCIDRARAEDASRVAAEMEAERAKVNDLRANQLALSKELAEARSQEVTQRRELMNASEQIEDIKRRHAHEIDDLEESLRKRERELREVKEDLRYVKEDLEREQAAVTLLKATVAHQSTAHLTLSAQNSTLEAQLSALKSTLDCKVADASQLRLELENARKRVTELEEEARDSEMIRRRLHNTIQELKGNIRVFCRVRPLIPSDLPPELANSALSSSPSNLDASSLEGNEKLKEECLARIEFPDYKDHKEIVLSSSSESATGQERKETWNFSFDRVFEPASSQMDIFEEVSQLAQSCTDGYNVCIFAYGQTGSGKSFTMEGGSNEETAGMIPRAVEQVFHVAESMRSKGWEYKLEGQFLEIYNETINDLLGKGEFDKKKHEIKHEKSTTKVTDIVVVPLKSASQVRSLLSIAQSRRTVASTLMNERSSRSHSVFTLRISGVNASGETCEGSLNLVDLAGSERLNSSGAGSDKDRLKETQNINKSLSALADVIAALGEKSDKADKHIPYRNSKLTYLLQNSLSGNSKTLMVLNLSPLAAHLGESLCSLRFATKVNNTTLGTAKRQARVGA